MAVKTMSLRLSEEKAAELEALAQVDEMSVSAAIREAIDNHIEDRRSDKEFQARRKRLIEENREVLDLLA